MKLLPSTKLHDLLDTFPFLLEFLADYRPKFSILRSKAMRHTMGRLATLSMASTMGDIPLDIFLVDIAEEIKRQTGKDVGVDNSASDVNDREKLDELKDIIKDLHGGVEFKKLKQRFNELIRDIEPTEIAAMEEELIREGMPAEEIQKLCDLHVTVFKDGLDDNKPIEAPSGHPVHTMMAENEQFSQIINELDISVKKIVVNPSKDTIHALKPEFETSVSKMAEIEKHYIRKENQLFPFLEKHGITGPSQVMWGIHDEIRQMLKDFSQAVDTENTSSIIEFVPKLSRSIIEMIYKENSILFPMAMDTLSEEEWIDIHKGEAEIGYAFVTPQTEWPPETAVEKESRDVSDESSADFKLDTGSLTLEQINLMLTHLPIEVSFVDENDAVRYYSDTPERIFPRSPGIIGRKVQNCHPPKSMHIVKRILESFKDGSKDTADFRIQSEGKTIIIRYFAVRNDEGSYRGTLEVTQDITEILGMKGEQRLLDWE